MNPLLAGLLVVVATAVSAWLAAYLHGEEVRRSFTRVQFLLLVLWFLVTYALMAFFVIPR